MNEAELRIAQTLLPRDWTPLRDVVLQVISFFGGTHGPGRAMINRYLHEGLLELALAAPDGTTTELSRTECERRTIHAPHIPAEGVRVEPFEAGQYFVRLASEPVSPVEPEPLRVEPVWDPRSDWSVATVKRELQIEGPDKELIIETLPRLYGDNIPAALDNLVVGKSPQAAKLRKAIGGLLEAEAQARGRTLRDKDIPSRDTCSRLLVAWRDYRAR